MELSIDQAKKSSAGFMYLWADENKFLRYIPSKYAKIIRSKKANQKKLLMLSAEKYKTTYDAYTQAIRAQFIEDYSMTPATALTILAQGGTVAGKNWSEGIFGIGATATLNFNGFSINDQLVTVDPASGAIKCGTDDLTDASRTVYKKVGGKTIAFQIFGYDSLRDKTFMSQYNSKTKSYVAVSWSDSEGTYSAKDGTAMSAADGADIWGNVNNLLDKFLDWLLKLFGVDKDKQLITTSNTLPSQTSDGFATVEASGIVVALAAGGLLLASGFFDGKKKRKGANKSAM